MLGLFTFVYAYVVFDSTLGYDGTTSDMKLDGALCYKTVVFAVTSKLLFDAHSLNWLLIWSSKLSVGAYFLFVYLEGLFPVLDATDVLF